eukprot:7293143-Alexandrium_andersonii.AAC.1
MSASLVGSEMCIRDRSPPCVPSDGALRAAGGAKRERAASSSPVPGHDPVSYTHLTLPTICSV